MKSVLDCFSGCYEQDVDMPAVGGQLKLVVVRKPHVCCECGETIELGQRYQRADGLWDGEWETYCICCVPCANIRDDVCLEAFQFGSLVEVVSDCLGFDYRKVPES